MLNQKGFSKIFWVFIIIISLIIAIIYIFYSMSPRLELDVLKNSVNKVVNNESREFIDEENVARGDLNNDGREDSVFITNKLYDFTADGGSMGGELFLNVVLNQNKNSEIIIVAKEWLGLAGDMTIHSLTIQSGIILVKIEMTDSTSSTPIYMTKNYKFDGNELILVSVGDSAIDDWKIYENEKYGFEIRYPENFYTTQEGLQGEGSVNPHFYVDFSRYKIAPEREFPGIRITIGNFFGDFQKHIDEIINSSLEGANDINGTDISIEDVLKSGIKIDDTMGYKVEGIPGFIKYIVYFVKNGKEFSVSNSGINDKIFDQILSTFKFNKQ